MTMYWWPYKYIYTNLRQTMNFLFEYVLSLSTWKHSHLSSLKPGEHLVFVAFKKLSNIIIKKIKEKKPAQYFSFEYSKSQKQAQLILTPLIRWLCNYTCTHMTFMHTCVAWMGVCILHMDMMHAHLCTWCVHVCLSCKCGCATCMLGGESCHICMQWRWTYVYAIHTACMHAPTKNLKLLN